MAQALPEKACRYFDLATASRQNGKGVKTLVSRTENRNREVEQSCIESDPHVPIPPTRKTCDHMSTEWCPCLHGF